MKKVIALTLAIVMCLLSVGCVSWDGTDKDPNKPFMVYMVTDTGGVNDQSFNMSAWEGLQNLSKETGAKVGYLESTQATDFETNMDKLADRNADMIWGIGFSMADSVRQAALRNPDIHYAIADNGYSDEEILDNLTGVVFKSQETAFLVGYVAGKTTKTNCVGFVGGISGAIIDQFEYGYKAGVYYASKEDSKNIKVLTQYADSFIDASKGKAMAKKMYDSGADIVFHAAGGVGNGVIEAAKDSNKFAIGVDRDQAYLAPKNVLTSALKRVGKAVDLVSRECMNGNEIGGKNVVYGLKEGCVGIPEDNPNMDPKVYEKTMKIQDMIMAGEITPPLNESQYNDFIR